MRKTTKTTPIRLSMQTLRTLGGAALASARGGCDTGSYPTDATVLDPTAPR